MKLTKMTTVAAVLVAYVCSISFGVTGALADPPVPTFDASSVTGTVTNTAGTPLEGQLVEFFDAGGNLVGSATTGPGGTFTITTLPQGATLNMVTGGVTSTLTTAPAGVAATAGAFTVSGAAASATTVAAGGVLGAGTLSTLTTVVLGTTAVGAAAVVTNQNKGS